MVELLQKEESKFIARNLRVANMVLAAKNALDRELQRIVPLLQARLKEEDWWERGWEIRHNSSGDEIYLTHSNWSDENSGIIWLGIESFAADSLFADAELPQLYVWIRSKEGQLWQKIATALEEHLLPADSIAEDCESPAGSYVILRPLNRNLPNDQEDINQYLAGIMQETFSFITHYAKVLSKQGLHKQILGED